VTCIEKITRSADTPRFTLWVFACIVGHRLQTISYNLSSRALQNTRIHTHCTQSEVVQLLGGTGDPKLTAVVLALLTAVEDIAVTFRRTSQVLFISTYLSIDGSSYICSCLSIYIHWYIHIHAHMHIHTRTYAYIHIHIRTSLTHTHALSLSNSPILSPLCLRMYCESKHTHTHTHTHTPLSVHVLRV